jgi:hypothetical protein
MYEVARNSLIVIPAKLLSGVGAVLLMSLALLIAAIATLLFIWGQMILSQAGRPVLLRSDDQQEISL